MAAGIRAIELAGKRKALLDERAAAVPPPREFTDRPGHADRAVLAICCPHCRAGIGEPCTVKATGRPLASGPHPSRVQAAPHTTNAIEGL